MNKVYKVTTDDGKIYIGCTKQAIKARMACHKRDKRAFIFLPHTIEILFEHPDRNRAEIVEAHYIDILSSSDPCKGYNRRLGGSKWGFAEWVVVGYGKRLKASQPGELNPMFGRKHSEDTKRKIAEKKLGIPSPIKGTKLSEADRLKRNVARAGKGFLSGENHPMYGKQMSQETRNKISATRKLR